MSETGVRMDVVAVPPWLMEIDPGLAAPLAERFEAAFVRCEGPRFTAPCASP